MNIAFIVGTRPQYIKLFPLLKELKKYHKELIIDTGQHFDKEMSGIFFNELGISSAKYNLGINSGLHGEQTGRMLVELEKIFLIDEPDLIIIFGDTNSTLSGALVGSKLQIPILHVEAGLRSFNKKMPEEINRIIADHISNYLFAPTQNAMQNLSDENLSSQSYLTGDIMVDSYRNILELAKSSCILKTLSLEKNNYYLLTLHRPYNVDEPMNLKKILKELGKLDKRIVFPVHPRTRKIIEINNISINENILIVKPLGYFDFVKLQSDANKIITDSGGIQKEAYFSKIPCITLRTETEWIETIEAGWNLLINPLADIEFSKKIISFKPPERYKNIFGENVAEKMSNLINKLF